MVTNGKGLNRDGNPLSYECVARLNIQNICVYLGSNEGDDPTFGQAVWEFGEILALNNVRLICGGGGRGLMRKLVNSVTHHGGQVTAITPKDLMGTEGGNPAIQEQIIVKSMGDRKYKMFKKADAFVAFPGGIGTLEELVEQLTWKQLGHHKKPICIYNHKGFYDPLLEVFYSMRKRCLITEEQPIEYAVAHTVPQILPVLCGERESLGRVHKLPHMHELFGLTAEGQPLSQS